MNTLIEILNTPLSHTIAASILSIVVSLMFLKQSKRDRSFELKLAKFAEQNRGIEQEYSLMISYVQLKLDDYTKELALVKQCDQEIRTKLIVIEHGIHEIKNHLKQIENDRILTQQSLETLRIMLFEMEQKRNEI